MHPLHISKEATSLDLFDAAQARHSAACDALRLLAGAPDLGCPDEGTLAGRTVAARCLPALRGR
ncbi:MULTISPECIES: hypothetical protein [unclassified Pseudomonas]|uniref:hypothetical protein n=1 Tax=unclassified Pseudomonas TaxID=196821 RepID=UPI000AFD56E3|nr:MULTISPECIES: hypothetical protein [unclassified Pseudomonas]QOF83246.1 hypothetical protein IG194_22100 [Pseudomonas sp. ADPe]